MRLRSFAARVVVVFAVVVALAGLGTGGASAHAAYKSSTPAADSVVQSAPSTILITFAEEMKALNVTVKGPGGSDITNGPALINLQDRANGSVPIHAAGNGRYEVDWNNVSNDDGDPDSGTFFFTVGAASTSGGAPAAPAPAAPAPAAPAAAPAPGAAPAPAAPAGAPAAAAAPAAAPASAPANRPASVASDGRTLASEPAATQALFQAVWGAQAATEWATEHTAQIGGR
jgi:methionine-rich copper-binding protein CopC